MRLLMVCPDMRTGGAERQWVTLATGLLRRGEDVRVLCLAGEGALYGELVAAGVPSECAGMRRRADPAGLRRALARAREAPHAVLTRGVSAQLVGHAISRRARAAHVLNEHTPLLPDGELLAPRRSQRLLTRLVAPRVDRVVAVTAAQVEPLARLGYRRERIAVVANGVPKPGPGPDRGALRARLGLAEGELAVLCAAALRAEKRVDLFVRAVAAARAAGGRVRGLVAGDGAERARLEPLAGAAGVTLLGERADVRDLMAAADVVCLLSDSEALPMSLLEAMALGLPVVATDVGGVAEAVVDGETGVLVAPGGAAAAGRALLALAADPERRRELGERARRRARERFGEERMVDGYLRVLREAAA
jgi:glycosyltransferase involved in cell wall biosynthesis